VFCFVFCFALDFCWEESGWLQGRPPASSTGPGAPRAIPPGLAAYEAGLGMTTGKGSRGAGGKSLQSSAQRGHRIEAKGPRTCEGAGRDLPGGVMEWSWLGLRIHAREFAMGSPGVVKVHPTGGLLLKFVHSSRHQTPHGLAFLWPHRVGYGPLQPGCSLSSAICWNSPASSDDPAPFKTMTSPAPLNADSVESRQRGLR